MKRLFFISTLFLGLAFINPSEATFERNPEAFPSVEKITESCALSNGTLSCSASCPDVGYTCECIGNLGICVCYCCPMVDPVC